jgi:hypothetical protein
MAIAQWFLNPVVHGAVHNRLAQMGDNGFKLGQVYELPLSGALAIAQGAEDSEGGGGTGSSIAMKYE